MRDNYTVSSIEVLSGLDPVRKRPGMYTDTSRPNHLAQEVIDNSVDEALAGYATNLKVILHEDQSIEVHDNGRGMPIDVHKEHGVSGVELVMTRLHAGGKFSNKSYRFSGGLHGVGISVVNALSSRLEVTVRKNGQIWEMSFENGEKKTELKSIGKCLKRETGTMVRFWPDVCYFDSPRFSVQKIIHTLRAKAVLCPGLHVIFTNKITNADLEWYFETGVPDYLKTATQGKEVLPDEPFSGNLTSDLGELDWAVQWLAESGEMLMESFVNLIPTTQGGTHVNGLRTGLLEGIREFCEFRNLLPRSVKLSADDIWENCSYVLSVKIQEPQFSGQTKERLSSRACASFVSSVIKDAFSLWLNQHTKEGEALAEFCLANAQRRLQKSKKITRKKLTQGPALPGKLSDCSNQDVSRSELFLVEGDSAGGSAKQARDREFQAIMPLRGKILNVWEVDSSEVLASQEIHDISVALGVDPGSDNIDGLRYGKVCILADADSDGLHIATLLCALFIKHFKKLVDNGHIYVAMPPLYRIDSGKDVFYALDAEEKEMYLTRIKGKKDKVNVQRFKGLGEMNPLQLRETTMNVDTRRLVQLVIDDFEMTMQMLDLLLAKKRSSDRKVWLSEKGNLIDIV